MAPRVVLRLPEKMAFSKYSLDSAKSAGMMISRQGFFSNEKEYIVINHGSRAPIAFGPNVKNGIVLNMPGHIKDSASKTEMYSKVEKAGVQVLPWAPLSAAKIQEIGFPLVIKPDSGHKGKGVQVLMTAAELNAATLSGKKIVQKYYPKTGEYRFNFIAGELVNVSRKILPEDAADHPGVFDGWLSLGMATALHKRAHTMAREVAAAFPELPSIAVDLMRRDAGGKTDYAFCEVNTGYGLGEITAKRIFDKVSALYNAAALKDYNIALG